jgi:prophage antirepressor-like protein
MNNELVPFKFGNKRVRVVEIDGSAWWAATDVCRILGHKGVSHAIDPLDDDEKITLHRNDFATNDSANLAESKKRGGAQTLNFISEKIGD